MAASAIRLVVAEIGTDGSVRIAEEASRAVLLGRDTLIVGTGGTLRNLAKIDHRARRYPIGSLHAYELSVDRMKETVDLLGTTKEKHRDQLQGLSAGRADSIVGGAVVIHTLAEFVDATHILVSGQGLREGLGLEMLGIPMGARERVREASLSSLVARSMSSPAIATSPTFCSARR